ncbi:unnamed protein product [Owenia fusiformis]|uniref:Uncharacterized protein n=1 Tax=Owenia fusiformis TaxID=6347 RepID=A0A8J1TJ15_OWEFU|nr:unnamed protein product [Owenia fusiformis]
MDLVNLADSDLRVSGVCIGTWQFNDGVADNTWDGQTYEVSKSIVDRALELGINFFDTAKAYNNSEKVLGRIFEGRRKDVVLATKFHVAGLGEAEGLSPEDVEKALLQSLQDLRTDYVDIYQVHWPNVVRDMGELVKELKRQQALGRIKYYSVCNFGPQNLKEMLAAGGQPLTNQLPYNLLWRPIEYDIVPICQQNNIDILPYSSLQQGLLSGKYTKPNDVPEGRRRTRHFSKDSTTMSRHGGPGAEAETFQTISRIREICDEMGLSMADTSLSWLLAKPCVRSVIVGARTPDQVNQNCKITKLSQEVVKKLDASTDELKAIFGNNPDMWAPKSRMA